MFSQTTIAGRLGQNPTVRSTTAGTKMATCSIASSQFSKRKQYTEWHNVVAFGDVLVELIEERLHKGDMIMLTGHNRTRKWTKDGVERSTTEVVMNSNDTLRFLQVAKAKAHGGHPPHQNLTLELPF